MNTNSLGAALRALAGTGYERAVRPLIFRASAQATHEAMLRALRLADRLPPVLRLLAAARGQIAPLDPALAGGVLLESRFVVAAGLVKGDGFASEEAAMAAVAGGRNIVPGWRSVPALAGPVEFGSYTRWPRLGNPGTVVWRDVSTRSTQNRVGLRNPGAHAAAAFLAARRDRLPRQFGINVAVSPGVDSTDAGAQDVLESFAAFTARGVRASWWTLNLSCPNTEDDPGSRQTAEQARIVCGAAVEALRGAGPLWVKVSPGLAAEQYRALMRVFAETGVRAVIATNTLGRPAPSDPRLQAGVGGGRLHKSAVAALALLADARTAHDYPIDLIGCGGVQDRASYRDFAALGASAVQIWSALVYRGPFAAALLQHDVTQMQQ